MGTRVSCLSTGNRERKKQPRAQALKKIMDTGHYLECMPERLKGAIWMTSAILHMLFKLCVRMD